MHNVRLTANKSSALLPSLPLAPSSIGMWWQVSVAAVAVVPLHLPLPPICPLLLCALVYFALLPPPAVGISSLLLLTHRGSHLRFRPLLVPRWYASLRPDPEGDDIPVSYFHGGSRLAYGDTSTRYGGFSSSVASRQGPYNPHPPYYYRGGCFGGPSFNDIPPFIFQCPEWDRVPPTSTLVASTLGDPVLPLSSLSSTDVSAPLPSVITMFFSDFLASSQGAPPGSVLGGSQVTASSSVHGGSPHPILVAFPSPAVFPGVPPTPYVAVVPAVVPPPALAVVPSPAPAAVLPPPAPVVAPPPPIAPVPSHPIRAELLKLDPMKDPKAFLDSLEQIQYFSGCLTFVLVV